MSNSKMIPEIKRIKRGPIPLDDCGMALAGELIGDKWVLLILREAFYGVSRFDDFRADISVPRAVLSQRLEKLVQETILQKVPYQEKGHRKRYEYRLTKRGYELAFVLLALRQWGDNHLRDAPSPVDVIDKTTGETVEIVLATSEGRVVPLEDVTVKVKGKS